MNRVILIKYGELTTKKGNRKLFINTLYSNILKKLKGLNVNIYRDMSRMYIEYLDKDQDLILKNIGEIFGIHAYSIAYKCDSNLDSIKETISMVIKDNLDDKNYTFKVETKRSDKRFEPNSIECNNIFGGHILKNFKNLKVNVHDYDILVHVEIRNDSSYVYLNEYKGLGGYPVGTLGKCLAMLSGGIDSPVASYLALKRGIKLDLVYFEAIPHTSLEARRKVINLARKLYPYAGDMKLIIVPFTKLQEAIYKNCLENYSITIMRRMMFRIMEKLTRKYSSLGIVNGESVGQVASQTLTSMKVINSVTNLPILRPVACFDKLEIIEIAKKIDTYDISILPYEDCCTIFVPKHPIINPRLDACLEMEKKFDYEEMIDEILNNLQVINIDNKEDEDYQDIL